MGTDVVGRVDEDFRHFGSRVWRCSNDGEAS
jgi:hypothetical protein